MVTVAQVVPSFLPILGGIESYTFSISRELVKRGHEVHVYTPDRVFGNRLSPKEVIMDGVSVHRIPVLLEPSYRLRLWPQLYRRLVDDAGTFDLIHVQAHDQLHCPTAVLAARRTVKPVIVTTYGPISAVIGDPALRAFMSIYDKVVTPWVFRMSDFILVKYGGLRNWVVEMGLPEWKIDVSTSGIPRDCFLKRDGWNTRKDLGLEGPVVLYMGRISPQKGVHHLVLSMALVLKYVPETTLLLVGPDYADFTERLLKLARKLGIEKSVMFHGPVNDFEEEMRIYACCDAFVMPSSFEGFGQAVHKAWSQGKPVVTTAVGAMPEFVQNRDNGLLVAYGKPKELAEAIVTLLKTQDISEKLGRAGYETARKYTYDVLTNQLENIYGRLLKR